VPAVQALLRAKCAGDSSLLCAGAHAVLTPLRFPVRADAVVGRSQVARSRWLADQV